MLVTKRNGRQEPVKFDKITARIQKLSYKLSPHLDIISIAKKVINGIYDGVSTVEIDNLAAETAATMATNHPDYAQLAARIAISNLHKTTSKSFANTMKRFYEYVDSKTNTHAPKISKETYQHIRKHAATLDAAIIYDRDYQYDFFGFKTLERSYLTRIDGKVVERPQQMLMRVAVGIHGEDIDKALKTYEEISQRWYTFATPTLFNAGTPKPQLSSCFLLTMQADSIEGIYNTLKQSAKISQSAGGVGLAIHNIRAKGTYIKGTGGTSNGIVPMLRNFDMTARYVDQGGGRRKGAFAIYLEPWHADIFDYLDLKKNHGKEELRARDLFYALWICDLFMQRVDEDKEWSLFCPHEAPGLDESYGELFEERYRRYEAKGVAKRRVKARDLWMKIIEAQIETGTPYMLYKDAANKKSNQKNLGTIKSSNLCTEIIEYTAPDEVAVCNLASISLPKYITAQGDVDHQKLYDISYTVAKNLNRIIDINYYPVEEARNSNMRHRPIGIGVQGLADLFLLLRLPFDSEQARKINKEIFETIYFGALQASKDIASKEGPYSSFEGSPASQGILQFDMWNVTPTKRWNWKKLKEEIQQHGLRNSLFLAPMPTASTSQILGNNECFEPYTSNIYVRRVLSGEFIVVNKHLLKDLIARNLWNESMKNQLISANGSVQKLNIPDDLKLLYRTAWEIPKKAIIDMSADRGAYICQSQSLNLYMDNPTFGKLTSMHFYAWRKGLKTGMYYLRTRAAADAIKFTVDKTQLQQPSKEEQMQCAIDNEDACLLCSG